MKTSSTIKTINKKNSKTVQSQNMSSKWMASSGMTPSKDTTLKSSTRTTSFTPQVSDTQSSIISKEKNKSFTAFKKEASAVLLSAEKIYILPLDKLVLGQMSTFMNTLRSNCIES